MGFLRFLSSLRTLAKNGDITIADAYKFAQQEFGEVSDLLKLQINKIFKDADAPSIKKPEQKGGDNIYTLIPKNKLRPAQMEEEGITFSVPEEGIFNQKTSLEEVTNMLTKNPFRSGGGLDPVEGMTRTAARVVLGRKNIEIPEKADPIDIFEENFGGDALMDLRQAGEELLEKEQTGRITESMGDFLESRGLFDLKVDKDAPKGITDEELLKKLTDDDPEEFAKGGRVGYDDGGITSLPKGLQKDTTTGEGANIFNMYAEKDDDNTFNMYAERPDAPRMAADEIAKVIMGTLGIEGDTTSRTFIFENYVMPKRKQLMENYGLTLQEADDLIREGMAKYRTEKATGGRVGYRFGSGLKLTKVLAIRGKTLVDEIKKAIDNFIQPSGDNKLDADVILDDMFEELNIDRDEIDQKDVLDAYGQIYDELTKPIAETLKNKPAPMTPKLMERFKLKEQYPGIDEDTITQIIEMDPNKKAQMFADMEMGKKLIEEGRGVDEVKDIIEKGIKTRKDNAEGGLNYLSGF